MKVTVRAGVAVDLRGDGGRPFTRGFLCQKMTRYLERVYSSERLLVPLRQVGPKGAGRSGLASMHDGARTPMKPLLSRWIRRRRPVDASHLAFTFYTRAQCCCCHKALDLLDDYRLRYGFTVQTVDVDSDAALAAAHGSFVPVVAVDGKVRFRGVINPVLLDRLLDAECRGD